MLPNIYRYDSALVFLQDFYNNKKKQSDLSLREWAQAMGLESPVLLVEILKKKRPLKLKYVSFLSKGLDLDANQLLYFQTLIQMNKAPDEEREYFLNLLNSIRPYSWVDPEGDVFSHWINGAILALGKSSQVLLTPPQIKKVFGDKSDLTDIKNSLHLLSEKGLFRKELDGSYARVSEDFVSTSNDTKIESTRRYYQQTISKACEAIDSPVEVREFQCFGLCMNEIDIKTLKDILRRTRKELTALYDKEGDTLFQVNLMGFPLGKIEKSPSLGKGSSFKETLREDFNF